VSIIGSVPIKTQLRNSQNQNVPTGGIKEHNEGPFCSSNRSSEKFGSSRVTGQNAGGEICEPQFSRLLSLLEV
jgi:hypothetical protein